MEPGEADVTVQEAEMSYKILDLGDTTVREVMVPLVEVVMLRPAPPRRGIAVIHERGFSRIPSFRAREPTSSESSPPWICWSAAPRCGLEDD